MEICRNIKIRILAFMMAFWLAFSVSYNDYQEVKALEWAVPVIGFDTALKFLLGLLGVSLTSKALHDNVDWNQVQQDCMDYQIQKGNDAVAVGEWWEDVAKGTLNQASSCWSAFKEWVQSLLSSHSAVGGNISNICADVVGVPSQALTNDDFVFEVAYYTVNYYGVYDFTFIDTSTGISLGSSSLSWSGVAHTILSVTYNPTTKMFYESTSTRVSSSLTISQVSSAFFWGLLSAAELTALNSIYHYWDLSDAVPSDWQTANPNIEDTDLTEKDTTTDAIPGALPLPWDLVGDNAPAIDDAISQAQEAVAEGEMDMADYWQMVLDLLNALAIDDTADPPISMPDNIPLPDIVDDNVSNGEFTLKGLEKVFPFCIPWDIKDFVTLLVAEPIAPVINYPFYNPATKQTVNIVIDFSNWESVVVLVRYIFDFLLIIGLLLLARQLAGAGGDD